MTSSRGRGLSAAELARRAGLHRVHDIESGKRNGSLATMRNIAKALDVPPDDLVWDSARRSKRLIVSPY